MSAIAPCDIGAFEQVQEAHLVIVEVIELFDELVALEDGPLTGVGPGGRARAG